MFAAEQGVSATRLSYWAKQLEAAAEPQFVAVPLPVRDASGIPARAAIEVELGGVTVRVFDGADTSLVTSLVAALQRHGEQRC